MYVHVLTCMYLVFSVVVNWRITQWMLPLPQRLWDSSLSCKNSRGKSGAGSRKLRWEIASTYACTCMLCMYMTLYTTCCMCNLYYVVHNMDTSSCAAIALRGSAWKIVIFNWSQVWSTAYYDVSVTQGLHNIIRVALYLSVVASVCHKDLYCCCT